VQQRKELAYSITSSAIASNVGGTVMPSALAAPQDIELAGISQRVHFSPALKDCS
jgi:hypothetical protein